MGNFSNETLLLILTASHSPELSLKILQIVQQEFLILFNISAVPKRWLASNLVKHDNNFYRVTPIHLKLFHP